MNATQAAAAIRTKFDTDWTAANPTVPVYWENENNELPSDQPFVHVSIRYGAARIATIGGDGSNVHRQSGEVIIRVFEISTYGMERARDYADDAATIFRGYRSGDLHFYTAALAGSPDELDGNVISITVLASFFFDLIG